MMYLQEPAAQELAQDFARRELLAPLVLGISPRGLELAAELASALDAEFGVVFVQSLRDPHQSGSTIGAIAQTGDVFLTRRGEQVADSHLTCEFLVEESRRQLAELGRRRKLHGDEARLPDLEGRSVILVDDGTATLACLIVALKLLSGPYHGHPAEVIVAVAGNSREGLTELRPWCDDVVFVPATARRLVPAG